MKRILIVSAALLPLLSVAAQARSDPQMGRTIAQQWCASCHQIGTGATEGKDVAPTFSSVANDHGKDLTWVATYLLDPHLPMMGIDLSRQQIDDVVAYIGTLQH